MNKWATFRSYFTREWGYAFSVRRVRVLANGKTLYKVKVARDGRIYYSFYHAVKQEGKVLERCRRVLGHADWTYGPLHFSAKFLI